MKFDKNFLLVLRQMLSDFEQAFQKVGLPEYVDQEDLKAIERWQELLERLVMDLKKDATDTTKNA